MSLIPALMHQELHSIYSDHHAWLYGWLRKKLGCGHQAADLAQDTFVRIISSQTSLSGVNEPRAFLTTTAKRLIIDQSRRQVIEQTYLAELSLLADSLPGFPAPEQILMAVQSLEQICRALESISVRAREAFLWHYLEEQTHAVIAGRLGVSSRMVQKYLAQALVACHHVLGDFDYA